MKGNGHGCVPSDKVRRGAPRATFTVPLSPGGIVLGRERGSVAGQRRRNGRETTDVVRGMTPPPSAMRTRQAEEGGTTGPEGATADARGGRADVVPSGPAASSSGGGKPCGAALRCSRSCSLRALFPCGRRRVLGGCAFPSSWLQRASTVGPLVQF